MTRFIKSADVPVPVVADVPVDDADFQGPIERAIRGDLTRIHSEHPMRGSLEQVCISLAQTIDAGRSPMAAAAQARELRAAMNELSDVKGPDDSAVALTEFLANLHTPVGDSAHT